ncbi:MAG: response regulator, partial [Candidatus Omnitrophica bacterium]|nr:response regulator [Candidatus Omnitrophota bacterium]
YLARRKKYETHEVGSGIEALEVLNTIKPDLIILDVIMPCMDGFQLLKKLKEEPKYFTIPVIMLTVKSSSKCLDAGISLGADFYLPKPFQLSNLMKFINLVLDNGVQ